jgi:hypothetical protein
MTATIPTRSDPLTLPDKIVQQIALAEAADDLQQRPGTDRDSALGLLLDAINHAATAGALTATYAADLQTEYDTLRARLSGSIADAAETVGK